MMVVREAQQPPPYIPATLSLHPSSPLLALLLHSSCTPLVHSPIPLYIAGPEGPIFSSFSPSGPARSVCSLCIASRLLLLLLALFLLFLLLRPLSPFSLPPIPRFSLCPSGYASPRPEVRSFFPPAPSRSSPLQVSPVAPFVFVE